MGINGHIILCEDYVSFEVAKLLKEKGFNGECRDYYQENGHFYSEDFKSDWNYGRGAITLFSAPTLQMAMKWLREVHNIEIAISPHEVAGKWGYLVSLHKNKKYINSKRFNQNYEDTIDLVLKEILTHLV